MVVGGGSVRGGGDGDSHGGCGGSDICITVKYAYKYKIYKCNHHTTNAKCTTTQHNNTPHTTNKSNAYLV